MKCHILDNHIVSEVHMHPELVERFDPTKIKIHPIVSQSSNNEAPDAVRTDLVADDIFSNLLCKEPECAEHGPHESISHLIEHYDSFHSFIPSELFQ